MLHFATVVARLETYPRFFEDSSPFSGFMSSVEGARTRESTDEITSSIRSDESLLIPPVCSKDEGNNSSEFSGGELIRFTVLSIGYISDLKIGICSGKIIAKSYTTGGLKKDTIGFILSSK